MIERRYIVKKIIKEEKPIVTWNDILCSDDYGKIRTDMEEVVTDIQIIGIYKSEEEAYATAYNENAEVECIYWG